MRDSRLEQYQDVKIYRQFRPYRHVTRKPNEFVSKHVTLPVANRPLIPKDYDQLLPQHFRAR